MRGSTFVWENGRGNPQYPHNGRGVSIVKKTFLSNQPYRRIKNILEAAIDHDVEALVLGAFGCGAFNNPPDVVAKAFQELLLEERYLHAFSRVAFPVKRAGWYCKNIEAFEMAFGVFPPTGGIVLSSERNKRRFFEWVRRIANKLWTLVEMTSLIQREFRTEYKRNGCGTHGKYIIFVPRKVLYNADIYIFSATNTV